MDARPSQSAARRSVTVRQVMPKSAGPAQSDGVVRSRHLEAMGETLGARYHELSTQLTWVHVRLLLG